jgi:alpha-tubulin suppressor-like RCC1 family protein
MNDGSVRCWGRNSYGQLGSGSSDSHNDQFWPVPVAGLSGVTALAPGFIHTCALLTGGTARCWGSNIVGELGKGSREQPLWRYEPVAVSNLSGAAAISAGGDHTCALLSDSTVSCWGSSSGGQVGNGTTLDLVEPKVVAGLSGALAVAAGGAHTCVLFGDANVQCFGSNYSGQIGNGVTGQASQSQPVNVQF